MDYSDPDADTVDASPAPRPFSDRSMLPVYLHMKDGSVRTIHFDCHSESAFQALERVYRATDGTDFWIYEVASITFSEA